LAISNALEGRTILITRPRSQTWETIEAVKQQGGRPLLFPVLAIMDPESWDSCDTALNRVAEHDAIVFTSANAVIGFQKRVSVLGVPPDVLSRIPVYAVGEMTAGKLEMAGFHVSAIPQNYSSAGLRELFAETSVRGKRFMLVQGSIARQDLREYLASAGAITATVVVYRTVEVVPPETDALVALLRNGAVDVVTFASPSAVRSFFHATHCETLFRAGGVPLIAVIGATTSDEVKKRGLPVSVVAKTSTMAGLVEAIRDYFLEMQK
jgi:uroporphyrinogen-III synthase